MFLRDIQAKSGMVGNYELPIIVIFVINPRRACAARVAVVVLCDCLYFCVSPTILALQATRRLMSDTNNVCATRA